MPVLSTTAYGQAEDPLNLARALMNDAGGAVFTDGTLMPLLNSAYRALQRQLADSGVSVLVAEMDLDLPVTSGLTQTEISDTSDQQLPTDLLAPHILWEQATGSGNVFVPMEKIVAGLPNLSPAPALRMWEWREDKINLVGATAPVTVRIRYEKLMPQLVQGTDPILIRAASDVLAYATAALAARARGARALAGDMKVAARQATVGLIERYIRPEQFKARRRRAYGSRRGIVYL
jgi:hypothetical protein